MLRPEGHITIGADGSGTNNFVGYLHSVSISPTSMSDEDIKQMYDQTKQSVLPSLGDDDFEETDPNSRFVLSPAMKPVFDKPEPSRSQLLPLISTSIHWATEDISIRTHIGRWQDLGKYVWLACRSQVCKDQDRSISDNIFAELFVDQT